MLAINPNTVLKAYRELDHEGLVEGRRGQGTFVSQALPRAAPFDHSALQAELMSWIRKARAAGFDDDGVAALFAAAVRHSLEEAA